jgi:hypothetical protein
MCSLTIKFSECVQKIKFSSFWKASITHFHFFHFFLFSSINTLIVTLKKKMNNGFSLPHKAEIQSNSKGENCCNLVFIGEFWSMKINSSQIRAWFYQQKYPEKFPEFLSYF